MKRFYYNVKSLLWSIVGKKILNVETARKMGLTHYTNLYGDFINKYNCRSLWRDEFHNLYGCNELFL